MDLRLRAEMPMHVTIPGADLELHLHSGEEIRMEISTKFTVETIRDELAAAGFEVTETWTDPADDFGVTLARRLDG
jgi:L-histidine N-alpha-methyltransferase